MQKPTTAGSQRNSESVRPGQTAWLLLIVLLLFSVAAPLNQFKVPPLMPVLMEDLRLSALLAGLMMSIFAVTGVILALPSGFIVQRAGYRITGLLAGGSIAVGSLIGAISPSVDGILMGRMIEGIGTCFIAVLAPAMIARSFPPRTRGTAIGVWSAWVPLGAVAMLILAPPLAQSMGWRAVWWFGGVYAALVTALFLVFVGFIPEPSADSPAEESEQSRRSDAPAVTSSQVLRNRDVWLLSAAFAFFNMGVLAFSTYMPTYLTSLQGLGLAEAALIVSIPQMITIFGGPIAGMSSDRLGSRRLFYLAGLTLPAVTWPLVITTGVDGLIVLLVAQGLFFSLVPTNIFSAAIETAGSRRHGGLAMAIIMVGQNSGMLLGPVIFGSLIESAGGWTFAFGSLTVMCLAGSMAGWLARVK